jgi:hypothetical protein
MVALPGDQVPRRQQFEANHPEIEIVSPVDNTTPFWKAYKAGQQIAVQAHLKYLLDQLETCV